MENIAEEKNNLKVGDIIEFGRCAQTADGEIKPIEWRVLEIKNGEAFLISKYGFDTIPYNKEDGDTSWEECSLRKLLNNDFYNEAFDNKEKKKIVLSNVTADKNSNYRTDQGNNTKDYVFLLSIKEVEKYFKDDDDRICYATDYLIENGAYYVYSNKSCWWWLRSLGRDARSASCVNHDGYVNSDGSHVYYGLDVVRPAIRIHI